MKSFRGVPLYVGVLMMTDGMSHGNMWLVIVGAAFLGIYDSLLGERE